MNFPIPTKETWRHNNIFCQGHPWDYTATFCHYTNAAPGPDYSDLHKTLDEAAYEVLVNYARRLSEEIDKLEAERRAVYDQIERMELKGQEAA